MTDIKKDIEQTIWGYNVFQQCVPEQYRSDISILVGKYYSIHPDESVFDKMWTAYTDFQNKVQTGKLSKDTDPLKYIKEHYND